MVTLQYLPVMSNARQSNLTPRNDLAVLCPTCRRTKPHHSQCSLTRSQICSVSVMVFTPHSYLIVSPLSAKLHTIKCGPIQFGKRDTVWRAHQARTSISDLLR